jgi:hypothetical protein
MPQSPRILPFVEEASLDWTPAGQTPIPYIDIDYDIIIKFPKWV